MKVQFRRGTAAQWTASNPTLSDGEIGLETDTDKMKFGDGVASWNSRPYANVGPSGTSPTLASVFPVGSVITLTVATNPATLYGFGTWAAFAAGRCLIGDGGGFSAGQTGGAATHTLTTPEIPSHNHTQDPHTHVQNAHTHVAQIQGNTTGTTTGTNVMGSAATGGSARSAAIQPANATAVNQNATATNQATGGGLAHNNMQPYVVVYMWTRTA